MNLYGVIAFDTLDNIKEATKTEVYRKYNYDKTRINGSSNNYQCVKNVILDVSMNSSTEYYLLDDHHYVHGV